MNWFAQTFRKVHIIYASPLWAKNRGTAFNAEEYADSLAAAGLIVADIWAGRRVCTVDRLGPDFLDQIHNHDSIEIHEDGAVLIRKRP